MAATVFKITIVQYWLKDTWIDAQGMPCTEGTPGARFVKSRKVKSDIPGAKKVKKKSSKWYGRLPGTTQPIPLSSNKVVALQMLAAKINKVELGKVGLSDPFEEHRQRKLIEHVEDFRTELEARGNAPRYVSLVHTRLKALCDGCEFRLIADISASKAMDWLARQRRDEQTAELPTGKGEFTRSEAAEALGMTATAFRDAVKRLSLPAMGKGKSRRYPRATVEAVRDRIGRGSSVQTTNYYISHLKSFCHWLVKDRRLAQSPVAHLEASNVEVDRRHDRRELTAEELTALLSATRVSKLTLRGMTGEDRFHLYATACGTGFRAGALASLTPSHFDLASEMPTVSLAAHKNKSRKTRVQPLPADLVELLRGYLAGKNPDLPLWGGDWAERGEGAEMLRADLQDAGIPYIVEGPDGPLYADFHALRHTYLTLGGRAGIDLRTLQELAGHSSPVLTARYMHVRLRDMAGSVEKLPSFLPTGPGTESTVSALKSTGTDGSGLPPVCTGFVQTNDQAREVLRLHETTEAELPPKAVVASAYGDGVLRQDEKLGEGLRKEAPPGIEPGMADLQSAALPLGEGAEPFGPYNYFNRQNHIDS